MSSAPRAPVAEKSVVPTLPNNMDHSIRRDTSSSQDSHGMGLPDDGLIPSPVYPLLSVDRVFWMDVVFLFTKQLIERQPSTTTTTVTTQQQQQQRRPVGSLQQHGSGGATQSKSNQEQDLTAALGSAAPSSSAPVALTEGNMETSGSLWERHNAVVKKFSVDNAASQPMATAAAVAGSNSGSTTASTPSAPVPNSQQRKGISVKTLQQILVEMGAPCSASLAVAIMKRAAFASMDIRAFAREKATERRLATADSTASAAGESDEEAITMSHKQVDLLLHAVSTVIARRLVAVRLMSRALPQPSSHDTIHPTVPQQLQQLDVADVVRGPSSDRAVDSHHSPQVRRPDSHSAVVAAAVTRSPSIGSVVARSQHLRAVGSGSGERPLSVRGRNAASPSVERGASLASDHHLGVVKRGGGTSMPHIAEGSSHTHTVSSLLLCSPNRLSPARDVNGRVRSPMARGADATTTTTTSSSPLVKRSSGIPTTPAAASLSRSSVEPQNTSSASTTGGGVLPSAATTAGVCSPSGRRHSASSAASVVSSVPSSRLYSPSTLNGTEQQRSGGRSPARSSVGYDVQFHKEYAEKKFGHVSSRVQAVHITAVLASPVSGALVAVASSSPARTQRCLTPPRSTMHPLQQHVPVVRAPTLHHHDVLGKQKTSNRAMHLSGILNQSDLSMIATMENGSAAVPPSSFDAHQQLDNHHDDQHHPYVYSDLPHQSHYEQQEKELAADVVSSVYCDPTQLSQLRGETIASHTGASSSNREEPRRVSNEGDHDEEEDEEEDVEIERRQASVVRASQEPKVSASHRLPVAAAASRSSDAEEYQTESSSLLAERNEAMKESVEVSPPPPSALEPANPIAGSYLEEEY